MPRKPKEKKQEEKIITDDFSDLPIKLKEFENKIFLDEIKVLQRFSLLLQKEMKEIKQIVSYILLAQEELMNNLANNDISNQDVEDKSRKTQSQSNQTGKDKKWN